MLAETVIHHIDDRKVKLYLHTYHMNRTFRYLLIFIFGISFILSLAYHSKGNSATYFLPHLDWRLHLSWAGAARNTILHYGQLPTWNPYRCGGVPVLGEPESDILSLYLPLLITFGPFLGYVALLILNFMIGCVGFYKLGKRFGLSTFASVLAGQAYMMSGLYILPFTVGMTNFLSIAYLPFIFLYFERYLDEGKFTDAIGAAFFISLMFLSGFHYIPVVVLYILLSAVIYSIQSKKFRNICKFVWVLILFISFSAIKFLPSIELLTQSGSVTYTYEKTGGYSLTSLAYSLLSRDQTSLSIKNLTIADTNFWTGVNYQIDENGMYIGIVLFALFILGMYQRSAKYSRLTYILIIFLIISFGTNIYPSIYGVIQVLPLVSLIRVANRFRYIFMVPVVLLIGFGFDVCMRYITRKFRLPHYRATIIFSLFLLCIGLDLLYVNLQSEHVSPMVRNIKIIHHDLSQTFYNHCSVEVSEYELTMQNQGNINCFDNVLFSTYATCKESADYRGEVYLQKEHGTATQTYFSPNLRRVTVTSSDADLLIVNQNYDADWKATIDGKSTPTQSTKNLLAIPLPKGKHIIEFYYFPIWLYIGTIISVLSLVLCGIYLWKTYK